MRDYLIRCVLAISAVLVVAEPVQAFVDPPTFEPVAPNSAQPVTALVRNGVCHFFGVSANSPPMRIERSPGIVDVIAPGFITFDPFCNASVATDRFEIGALPAGTYEVRIWIIDGTDGYLETIQVASAPLTVTQGPAAQPIPAIGTAASLVLAALIVASQAHAERNWT